MSLINQMLKDLEDRKESSVKGQNGIISRPNSRARSSRAPLIFLSLITIGLLITVLYLLWWQPLSEQASRSINPPAEIIPPPVAPAASTTTIASLVEEAESSTSKIATQPTAKLAASETPVVIAPRLTKQPAIQTSPLQRVSISRLSPAELNGGWQRQKLTVIGDNFKPTSQIQLCWPTECTTLKDKRIRYLSPTELQISITTGTKQERWQLTVRNPNGQASNTLSFYVKAVIATNDTTPEQPATDTTERPQGEGETISKRIIPLTAYQQAETYYLEANQSEKAHDSARAISLWERAILLAPEHHASRQKLINKLIASGRTVEAEGHITQGIKLFPNDPIYHQRLAQIHASQGDTDGAIAIAEGAIKQGISSAELYAFTATLYQRNKQFSKSIERYQRALALKPGRGIWWVGLGISFEQNSQFTEALSAYQQAQDSGSLSIKLRSYVEGQIAQNQRRIKNNPSN
ncbi:MAG: tetratricopeptide repeat protein [Chromatiales bacterium]|nr:tetratricopeptide repeat protein [Chromatiales bacterium]